MFSSIWKRWDKKGILDQELHQAVEQNFLISREYEPAPNDSSYGWIFEIFANS